MGVNVFLYRAIFDILPWSTNASKYSILVDWAPRVICPVVVTLAEDTVADWDKIPSVYTFNDVSVSLTAAKWYHCFSLSGVPILPSKRARKIPEKIQLSKDDLAELNNSPEEQTVEIEPASESPDDEVEDVSLDNLKDEEIANTEQEDSESTNS